MAFLFTVASGSVFTVRRFAVTIYAVVVCVSVYVCLSDARRYCIKTAKLRIIQTMPHYIPATQVF